MPIQLLPAFKQCPYSACDGMCKPVCKTFPGSQAIIFSPVMTACLAWLLMRAVFHGLLNHTKQKTKKQTSTKPANTFDKKGTKTPDEKAGGASAAAVQFMGGSGELTGLDEKSHYYKMNQGLIWDPVSVVPSFLKPSKPLFCRLFLISTELKERLIADQKTGLVLLSY